MTLSTTSLTNYSIKMPITINVVDHEATACQSAKVSSDEKLLQEACPRHYLRCRRIVQSSFSRSSLGEDHVSASRNGFVWAAYHAYSSHKRARRCRF